MKYAQKIPLQKEGERSDIIQKIKAVNEEEAKTLFLQARKDCWILLIGKISARASPLHSL